MRRTITWVLYILMGVQIAFGCVYLVSNFGAEQQFRENIVSFLPAGAVCLVQLIPAAVSLWYVLGKFGFRRNKYLRGYVCAFLLTVPFLLQMHMARLVWSVSFSAFLWLLGLILETMENGRSKRRAVLLPAAWFFYGILCPDGLWLGGILLLASFLFSAGRKRKNNSLQLNPEPCTDCEVRESMKNGLRQEKAPKRLHGGVCFGLAVFLVAGAVFLTNLGLNNALPQARRIYRENNFGTAVISRFVWPNFGKNYFFWNLDVKAVLSEEDAVEIDQRVDLIAEEFYPALEETYGRKKATEMCLEMGRRCLKDRTRETVSEIGRDLKDYFLLPFTIEKNLKGEGVSLTAWNYGRMREHTPFLVKYYYRYGVFELPFLLLGSFLLLCLQRNDRIGQMLRQKAAGKETKKEYNQLKDSKKLSLQWRFLVFTWILYTLWYTMRSNLPVDYKMALPILFIWYLASVVVLSKPVCSGDFSSEPIESLT